MKNIEKIYGIQINIREQIDAEHSSFYKSTLERIMRFVNFDLDNYYVYVHFLTITNLKDKSYFGRNIPLQERIKKLTLIYKVNPKQRKNMEFMNEYGNFNFSEGIEHSSHASQVQFIFNSEHIKEGVLETKLITFLKKDFIRPDHFKIKLEVKPHPTEEFEKKLRINKKNEISPRLKRILKNKRVKENLKLTETKIEKSDKADSFTEFDLYFSKQIKFTIPQLLVSINKASKEKIKNNITIDDFISDNLNSIELIMSEKWNIYKKKTIGEYELTLIKIEKWLSNFSINEFDYALEIMGNIKVFSKTEVENMIRILSETIRTMLKNDFDDVYFFGMGESPSDSGSQLLYSFRKSMVVNESKFPKELSNIQNLNPKKLFFFDDIIGTGKQATTFYNNYLKNLNIDCYYCSLVGFENGINNLNKNAGFKKIIPCIKLGNENKAFSNNSINFPDSVRRNKIKKFAIKYGNKLYPKGSLGYDGSEALIVFPHNVPNNTLPIIWAGPSNEKEITEPWFPLFERQKI